jgi:hypothetical protein
MASMTFAVPSARSLARRLRDSEQRAVGDPRRGRDQRVVARAVHDAPALADHESLRGHRTQLRAWSRWVPHLLDDATEDEIAAAGRPVVADQLARLAALDRAGSGTDLAAVEQWLRVLDEPSGDRRSADLAAAAALDQRAEVMADILHRLTVLHAADDERRGIDDWRLRSAVLDGTTTATQRHCLDLARDALPLAHRWFDARAAVVGASYSDRRVGRPIGDVDLAGQVGAVVAALTEELPAVADAVRRAGPLAVAGSRDEVSVDLDGGLSVMVDHRPTARSRLMTAHEIAHAVHVVVARDAGVAEPPGALVAETVACWSALSCGRRWAGTGDVTWALALGDHLVNELFMSAALCGFEDALHRTVRHGSTWTTATADDVWHEQLVALYGPHVEVPRWAASGWSRHPALVTEPGAPFRYVWATLLAAAVPGGDCVPSVLRSTLDADELPVALGVEARDWAAAGLDALETTLDGLVRALAAG